MQAGKLRHEIDIQSKTETRNSYAVEDSWSTDATVRCSIEPLTSKDIETANKAGSQASHKITIRYYDGFDTDASPKKILFGSRVFYLAGIPLNLEERNKVMELTVIEDT